MRQLSLFLAASSMTLAGCQSSDPSSDGAVDASKATNDADTSTLFSFFVTSMRALQDLSGNANGFGGDLRFGETGPGAGLRGADKICAAIAERSLPGSAAKMWRAFLSANDDGTGKVVNAIDRIGNGPWYDRVGRLLAPTRESLMSSRPRGGDATIVDDFPNEDGVPNHAPDPTQDPVDNHDMLTGTDERGQLYSPTSTCLDWTSNVGDLAREGRPRVGHSWPRFTGGTGSVNGPTGPCAADAGAACAGPPLDDAGIPILGDGGLPPFGEGGLPSLGDGGFSPFGEGGFSPFDDGGLAVASDGGGPGQLTTAVGDTNHWMSALDESGCAAGINIRETGGPLATANTVGSGGGYGGFYCFALTP